MKKFPLLLLILLALHGCAAESGAPVEAALSPSPMPSAIPAVALVTPDPEATPEPSPENSPEPSPEPESIVIQMGGDILLHSKLINTAKTGVGTYDFNPFFAEIAPYINGDLNICNIESPIDVFGGNKDLSTYPRFNAPFEILEAVKNAGFNFFVNANNHSFDKGWNGLVATRANLEKSGVAFTGTYETKEQSDTFAIADIKGIKVGIIAYTDSLNGLDTLVSSDKRPFAVRKFSSATPSSISHMIDDIEACREQGAELVVVSLHWGAEYVNAPSKAQREIAERLSLGGADIIMGNHSHCVQPIEWLEGKNGGKSLCVYSLGNLFADQNDMVTPIRKTQYSMLVSVHAGRDESGAVRLTGAEYIPTFMHRYADASSSTGVNYILLPSGDFFDNENYFTAPNYWKRCMEAYEHVTRIVGPDAARADVARAAVSLGAP